jgi:hypothetical protein
VPIVFTLGAVQPRPVVEDGEIVIRQRMKVGMSADHRFMDGFHMAVLFDTLREWLTRPYEHFGPIPQGVEAAPAEPASVPAPAVGPAAAHLQLVTEETRS